ncbi:hypothetical protein KSS87_005024 [Heliosperma pusillum]|nr:hypothetical protein KSS87_005024 [Heliosperma pusillum]
MYKERGGASKVSEMADRKRINEALDKQLEKSSPSTSKGVNSNAKDSRLSTGVTQSIIAGGKQPVSLPKNPCSDGSLLCLIPNVCACHDGAVSLIAHIGATTLVNQLSYSICRVSDKPMMRLKPLNTLDSGCLRIYDALEAQDTASPNLVAVSLSGFLRTVDESETDSEESDVSGSEGDDTSWISWFCTLRGNEFFCEVDDDYIQDDFNLCGLSSQVPYYDYALDLILDVESSHGDMFTEEQNELVESAAEMLYGLIHARYILTSKGMAAMLEKFKNYDCGRCPRAFCVGQPCLPVGQSDLPRSSTVKIYCPKCEDIYYPRSKYQGNVDGAYFGTTFPHLFLMTYPHLKPQKPSQNYTPRVFGFKLHKP